MEVPQSLGVNGIGLNESYRPLPSIFFAFLPIWFVLGLSWTINTWKNRYFQINKLHWILASVPLVKVLQLSLSSLFWYSCFNLQTCSLWMSFGVYVTGILFQTAAFMSFLLISHGYCIMSERLSVLERRTTAALVCVFYLTLVGYRAFVPYFTVILLLNYFITFYVIFHHISQNLLVLHEQLSFIEDENVRAIHDSVYTKYTMFRKFQGVMLLAAVTETVIYIIMDDASVRYWLRILVREGAQFFIFLYIGWTFRSLVLSPHFSVMPILKSKREKMLPPIYSIEMDAAAFKVFSSHEWHIGVPTYSPPFVKGSRDSFLFIVQHPCAYNAASVTPTSPSLAAAVTTMTTATNTNTV